METLLCDRCKGNGAVYKPGSAFKEQCSQCFGYGYVTINLPLFKQITFDELIQHGRENGANIVNDMPWSWKINGKAITHENDNCYIIETANDGFKHFESNNTLLALENGLHILTHHNFDTHAPGSCPL